MCFFDFSLSDSVGESLFGVWVLIGLSFRMKKREDWVSVKESFLCVVGLRASYSSLCSLTVTMFTVALGASVVHRPLNLTFVSISIRLFRGAYEYEPQFLCLTTQVIEFRRLIEIQ
jgi:hypothetical protein